MSEKWISTKILITVMTYPHPSRGYKEVVCTAGITEDNNWVRLYPIDYRYLPSDKRFKKYQWVDVLLQQKSHGNDNRKESRKPDLKSFQLINHPLSPKKRWEARRKIIDKLPHKTVNQLRDLYNTEKISLGIVRPVKVIDLKIEKVPGRWKPAWKMLFSQLVLFGKQQKPLRKIPFKFSYIFECEDSKSPHSAMIEDWELGVLWLKEFERLKDEKKAAKSVRNKYLHELCDLKKNDTRFFMGTTFPYNSWVVLGVFYPPKGWQPSLF